MKRVPKISARQDGKEHKGEVLVQPERDEEGSREDGMS